ncbi:MAG: hypothetical protein IKG56_05365 [Clostridia bacterium]|nr:hypothetical protein [Clostridia bacterium]
MSFKYIELTKDNYHQYLGQVADLEEQILALMSDEGRDGQFFATGYDDILEYILSEDNTVLVAIDDENRVQAASYITKGQIPFTYNDITKYYKKGSEYEEWVRSQYESEASYKDAMLDAYALKMKAYAYAKSKILGENPQYSSLSEYLQHELEEPENGFHEKSKLRDDFNKYMSEYVENEGKQELYEQFYWTTSDDIARVFGKEVPKGGDMEEYEQILTSQNLDRLEEPNFVITPYFSANTGNSVEIDTYITSPDTRSSGLSRILVYEGIKKYIKEHFKDPKQREIFLCSTLHRENISSKYVSEFFGLKDNLLVNRRFGRTREVHIKRISREEAEQYLLDMQDKLAVLYGYNPDHKRIPVERQIEILEEQKGYDMEECRRIQNITFAKTLNGEFSGENTHRGEYMRERIRGKIQKVFALQKRISKLRRETEREER